MITVYSVWQLALVFRGHDQPVNALKLANHRPEHYMYQLKTQTTVL